MIKTCFLVVIKTCFRLIKTCFLDVIKTRCPCVINTFYDTCFFYMIPDAPLLRRKCCFYVVVTKS